ncbi:AI-2E family transporter [Aurantiacibacter poecillastricola]|uniref:AI-2E family transporter n=1 Tax=Aurantiacibacter poecillastricola TaxID=3064385 RepID=UPI00273D9696|nr:AI-2E family transporter [Aurantiacibacter sp. 219JJ12-13]MDP5260796.1 AI-2E family transporter [Aurantiacibacter sp. 219JJ12-13]
MTTQHELERENRRLEGGGYLLFLALVTLGFAFIIWPFLLPILWAALAAIMFQPMVRWFRARLGGDNRAAIATLLVITVAIIIPAFLIGGVVVEQATAVVVAFQEGRIDLAAWFETIFSALPATLRESLAASGLGSPALIQDRAQELALESSGLIARQAVSITGSAFGFVLAFGVGLYVAYFLLRDGKRVGSQIIAHLPLGSDIARELADRFLLIVRATVKGSIVVGLAQGALGAITYWIVGMPSVVLLGLLTAFFSLLPAVGPAIVWAPIAIYLLATGAIWQGVVVLVSGVAIIGMADNVLRPILVGRDTGIPDWIILVSTLGGIAAMGLAGIVVGPMAAGLFLAGWSILYRSRRGEAVS